MDKYVSTIDFIANGQQIDDFQTFEEDARVLRKTVNLMKKTGVMSVTPRYGFKLGYVVPTDKPRFDFEGIEGGTVVIEKDSGGRITFTDVSVLEVGSLKFDGDKEATQDISFIAGNRIEE